MCLVIYFKTVFGRCKPVYDDIFVGCGYERYSLMSRTLSIIVPAYNESSRLGDSLEKIFRHLETHYPGSEVIVVDDGSTDDTVRVAEESFEGKLGTAAYVIRVKPNRGKGHAVRQGLLAAKSSIALFTDSDLSTPIEETSKLVDAIESGEADIAFGSRALDRSLIGVHQSWRREQGGRFFNLVVRLATGMPYWDTQCGFKAFNMTTFRPICEASRIDRFGFDVELLYVSYLAGLRLKETPVRWDHNEGSKLNVLSDTFKAFDEIRSIRKHVKNGSYDGAMRLAKKSLEHLKSQRKDVEAGELENAAFSRDELVTVDQHD